MARCIDWPEGMRCTLRTVVSGETCVTAEDDLVISTVLGSCVSVCLFDPVARVGGANHYFLSSGRGQNASYGAVAMELVINGLMRRGAERSRLRAKVFGGALMKSGLGDIGKENSKFALEYLQTERMPIIAMDLGGFWARRLHFHPTSGRARVVQTKQPQLVNEAAAVAPSGATPVELF